MKTLIKQHLKKHPDSNILEILKEFTEYVVGEEKGVKVHLDLHTNTLEEGHNNHRQETIERSEEIINDIK